MLGFAGFQGELGAVVGDLHGVTVGQQILGALLGYFDPEPVGAD
jgi:hypothetical protein